MSALKSNASLIIGSILAVLFQIILAPSISLMYATPNFILVFVVVASIFKHSAACYVTAFVLGLIYNLIGTSTVGAMAVCLLLLSFVLVSVFSVIEGSHPIVAVPTLLVSCIVVEVLYALVLIALGQQMSFVDACIYGAIPNAIYDVIVGLIIYPIASSILRHDSTTTKAQINMVSFR